MYITICGREGKNLICIRVFAELCSIFFFFPVTAENPILRFSALLFNFQSQKSFSVLLVYKNLTHLHTNKTRSPRTVARVSASKSCFIFNIHYIIISLPKSARGAGRAIRVTRMVVLQKLNVVYVTVMKHLQDGGGILNKRKNKK